MRKLNKDETKIGVYNRFKSEATIFQWQFYCFYFSALVCCFTVTDIVLFCINCATDYRICIFRTMGMKIKRIRKFSLLMRKQKKNENKLFCICHLSAPIFPQNI